MPAALTQEQAKQISANLFDKLASTDPMIQKEAVDGINEFTRTRMREDSFMNRIMPSQPISNDELDRNVSTDKPIKVIDKEPDSPAAITIPFATLPMNLYIRGNRYLVMMDRIVTPRFTKDVDELRTWVMDIRQVLSDNAIKDMLAELDGKFIFAVNTALVGANVVLPTSGKAQYQTIPGGITRDSLWDAFKVQGDTPFSLEVNTVLVNHITIKDVAKLGRDEMGGDLSVDIMKNGWTEKNFMGVPWIITIKKDLVPTGHMYTFADPKFIGKHFELEPTTMYVRREAFMIEFFSYRTGGATLGHTGGFAHISF